MLIPAGASSAPMHANTGAVRKLLPGLGVWAAVALAVALLDGPWGLDSLALLLVLGSALAALWLPGALAAAASIVAVLLFNWYLVPPRGSLQVALQPHLLLLATMLLVNLVVALLVLRQRQLAAEAAALAARESRLRRWADRLRDADDPAVCAGALREALLQALPGSGPAATVAVELVLPGEPPRLDGELGPDHAAGLALARREARPLGPGTGRHDDQPDLYLPLRGREGAFGAAVVQRVGAEQDVPDAALRAHLQALCDALGQALERGVAARRAREAESRAQAQSLQNTLLAAVAHDHRTPLATIVSAASSLRDQGERLDPGARRRLAAGIVDEAERLAELTTRTLQLARLGALGGDALQCDWQAAEELVAVALARARRRPGGERVVARTEPGLPLVWADATRLSQLLDNLVDNALRHGAGAVEIEARRTGAHWLLAVADRGAGVPMAQRGRLFEPFRRGDAEAAEGSGLGLALVRAIVQAHGGTLAWRERRHGGSRFECRMPLREAPPLPPQAAA
jgi:two-component system sensor histidine kinase KdpD